MADLRVGGGDFALALLLHEDEVAFVEAGRDRHLIPPNDGNAIIKDKQRMKYTDEIRRGAPSGRLYVVW